MAGANKVTVEFTPSAKPGCQDVVIRATGCRLVADRSARKYVALDVSQGAGVKFDCDGTLVEPRLIVKIFCQIKPQHLRRHLLRRGLKRINEQKSKVIDIS
jgi:hypothetical protein